MGQRLDVLGKSVRIETLESVDDTSVQRAPTVLEHAAIRHVVGQRVLEGVLEIGEDASLVKQLGGLQPAERGVQIVLTGVSDRLEQRERNVLPDDGCRL